MNRRQLIDVLIAIAIAAAVLLLYRKITRLWWTYDDAYLLHLSIIHPARDHFLGGSLWRSMPQQLFTPLLTASYDSELSLFGPNAADFYRIHLAELMLAAAAVYAAMRMWLDRFASAAGALLFIAGAPLANIATELMLMHYVESIILGAIAVVFFARACRQSGAWQPLVASAAFYFAAILAKEVAVPLIAVLLLLPSSRPRFVAPHAIALAVYTALRWSALGTLFGGYGWVIDAADVPRLLLLTPIRTLAVFAGPQKLAGALLLLITGAAIAASWRSKRIVLIELAALALAIAPTLPVAKEMQTRFALIPWLCWSVLFVIAAQRYRALQVLALIAVLVVNRQAWNEEFTLSHRMSDEARVFFDLGANDLLRTPKVPPAAMGELQWLKEQYAHRARGAAWFYDDIFLCETPLGAKRVFEYETAKHAVVEATPLAAQRARTFCAAIRADAPLSARFRFHGESLYWDFGPYDAGTYTVVIANGLQAFTVPRHEAFRMRGVAQLPLRVRYDSPAGWTTYSAPMTLDLSKPNEFTWQR